MQLHQKKIIFHLLASDPGLVTFLFESASATTLRAPANVIINNCWELLPEQRILVRAALDILNSQGNVFLWEILTGLNPDRQSRVLDALIRYREWKIQNKSLSSGGRDP